MTGLHKRLSTWSPFGPPATIAESSVQTLALSYTYRLNEQLYH